MQRQIKNYIRNYLSPHLCQYRKDYNTQQFLISLIEQWTKILDNEGLGCGIDGLIESF